jgi:O-antigen/teichoic acid export membrane protein
LNTAWTFQVLRGVLLWCIAALLAGLMAQLYGQGDLRQLIPAAGLTVLINGFDSISLIRMQRHLQIGKLAAIEITGKVVAVVVMISWALVHPTVWALVAGGLTGAAVKMVLSHAVGRQHALRFAWDRPSVRQLLDFGKWIFISTFLTFLAGQADRLIFGRLLSVATLGVYSIALMFATLPTQLLFRIGNLVIFPVFSRRQESDDELEPIYRRAQKLMLIAGGLPVACMAASGPALIEALYDPRYADAGWMLQLLAFGTWMQILQTTSGSALLALGEPRWLAIGNALKFAGMLVLLPSGFVFFGAAGGIAGLVAAELFRYGTLARGVRRHDLPTLRTDLGPSALVLAATLGGLGAAHAIGNEGSSAWLRLGVAVGAVLLLLVPVAAVRLRREIPHLLALIRASRPA